MTIIDPPIDATDESAKAGDRNIIEARPPSEENIRAYFRDVNPLSLGEGEITITDIDPPRFSGHFNYLIESANGNAVLRLKGPEWGTPIDGIENEYNILKYVERYDVAPNAIHFDRAGIDGAPLMLLEYLDGKLFTDLNEREQGDLLPSIGTLIAEINSIPVERDALPFDYPLTSYAPHKDKWWRRVSEVSEHPVLSQFAGNVQALLPRAEELLDKFEASLKTVIERGDSSFVFVSSHASHLMVTAQGLRFLNWEAVRYGDPTFTLAVFLSSISDFSYAEEARKVLVRKYLEERPVADFEMMLNQRLVERAVSDLTWLLWMESKKIGADQPDMDKLQSWYDRAANMLTS